MKKKLSIILTILVILSIIIIIIGGLFNKSNSESLEEVNKEKISKEEAFKRYEEDVARDRALMENNKEVLEQVKNSIETNTNCVSSNYKGYEKIDELLEELRKTNEKEFNLTKYFDFIINPEQFKEEVRKVKPEATDEDVERIYNTVLNYNPNFVEEETIYINENGEKCIKICDIRRLHNNDGIVKYFNGEYQIYENRIPSTYNDVLYSKNEHKKGVYNDGVGLHFDNMGEVIDNTLKYTCYTDAMDVSIIYNYENKEILDFIIDYREYLYQDIYE